MTKEGDEASTDDLRVSPMEFVLLQIFFLVNNLVCRTTDLLVLLPRPRLLRAYLGIWIAGLRRSPYRWPRSFEAVRAVKASGQTLRELMYGETPLISAIWLLWRAGLRKGSRFVDLGAGRGRALLAARWLGAEARGIELLEDHVSRVAGVLRPVGIELVTGDALQAPIEEATHIYVNWTGFSPNTRLRLVERFRACRPGTRIITVTQLVEAPGFVQLFRQILPYTWGLERAWVQERRP